MQPRVQRCSDNGNHAAGIKHKPGIIFLVLDVDFLRSTSIGSVNPMSRCCHVSVLSHPGRRDRACVAISTTKLHVTLKVGQITVKQRPADDRATHMNAGGADIRYGEPILDLEAPQDRRGRLFPVYLGVCFILVGLNLRTVFSSFSAILAAASGGAGLSGVQTTVLATVPVFLLGVCAPAAPFLARRFGTERAILGCIALLAVGLGSRGIGTVEALLLGTFACGIAIAVGNVLVPVLIKYYFPSRQGVMSGAFTAATCASAALSAGWTHPVYAASGSWRGALAIWALPAGLALLVFMPLGAGRRVRPDAFTSGSRPGAGSIWRSGTAWHATIFMVLQAMMSFSVFTWLAPILHWRGIDQGTAGLMVAISIMLQVAGSLTAPAIAARCADQRSVNVAAAIAAGACFGLSVFGPLSLIWVWTLLLGLGQGSMTALALAMAVFRARDSQATSQLSGMMQGVGYGIGASGTLLVGMLHHLTGGFAAAGVMFWLIGGAGAYFGSRAGRARFCDAPSSMQPEVG